MNIPEFAESIISVEVLVSMDLEPSNQVLAERVRQSSLGNEGQASKSWRREPSNQVLAEKVEQQEVLTVRVEQ